MQSHARLERDTGPAVQATPWKPKEKHEVLVVAPPALFHVPLLNAIFEIGIVRGHRNGSSVLLTLAN